MSGSTWGGVVGGVIGWFVGGPSGAYYGWMIGSAVGGYVDPVQIEGPRLKDIRGQTSTVGGSIPRAWGTAPVPTNIIWQQDGATEHSHTQGKGGTEQKTYSYTRSYAVMFHLGEIAGVLQIKRNGKLVYDARPDAVITEELNTAGLSVAEVLAHIAGLRAANAKWIDKCTIYTGTQTQNPDPTIESYLGAGNVPSYHGRAYMVVTDDDVTAEGGSIPQIDVVVAACGTTTSTTAGSGLADWFIVESRISGSSLSPSTDGADWSSLSTVDFVSAFNRSFSTPRRLILWSELAAMNPYYTDDGGVTLHALPNPGGVSGGSYGAKYINGRLWIPGGAYGLHYSDDEGDSWVNSPKANNPTFGLVDDKLLVGHPTLLIRGGFGGSLSRSIDGGTVWSSSLRPNEPAVFPTLRCGDSDGLIVVIGGESDALIWTSDGLTYTNCTLPGGLGSGTFQKVIAPANAGEKWMAFRTTGSDSDNTILLSTDGKTWSFATGYAAYTATGGAQCAIRHNGRVTAIGTSEDDDQVIITTTDEGATWVDCADSIPSGNDLVSISGPPSQWSPESTATPIPDAPGWYVMPDGTVQGPSGTVVDPCAGVEIREILEAVCSLSGLSEDEYDWSAQTTTVTGYVIARETDASSVIESLRPIGMFDVGEWDAKVRGVNRGGTAVGSINDDDLVERDGDAFERELVQESELLRRVTTGYIDKDAGFSPNTQKYERRAGTVRAMGEASFEVSAVMDADQAATVSKRKVLSAWGEPEKQKFSLLSLKHAKYTPTDILNYTDEDGEVQELRLMKLEDDSGVRYAESSSNCAEAYDAVATGVAPKPPTVTGVSLLGPTLAVYMNLPNMRSQDTSPGVHIAVRGLLPGWTGASILMSVDGGDSYQTLVDITQPADMGVLTADCTESSEPISVSMGSGTLSSITDAQIDSGLNAFAITTDDVSELGQFKTATPDSGGDYDLTNTVRGLRGTTAAEHDAGDPFVIVATTRFVPLSISLAGKTLYFKAVTFGTSADSVEAVPFVFNPLFTSISIDTLTYGGEVVTVDGQPIYVVTTNA